MKIVEGDMEEIKNLLQNSWHARSRWVVYEDCPIVTAKSMTCFRNAHLANDYCEKQGTDNLIYKFKSIASVLKSIFATMGRLVKEPPSIRRLEMEIKQKSLLANSWDDDLVKSLQTGEIYPVIQQRVIDPQAFISSYKILKQHEGPQTVSGMANSTPTEIASFRDYGQAVSHFQQIYKEGSEVSKSQPSYFLVGEFKGYKLVMGRDGYPEENTGLLLSMCRGNLNIGDNHKPYSAITVHDPKSPTVINLPMLAQYDSHMHKINLMDGDLKAVDPGKLSVYFKVDHFAFKSPIFVEFGPLQFLRQLQYDKETIKNTLRNRI